MTSNVTFAKRMKGSGVGFSGGVKGFSKAVRHIAAQQEGQDYAASGS